MYSLILSSIILLIFLVIPLPVSYFQYYAQHYEIIDIHMCYIVQSYQFILIKMEDLSRIQQLIFLKFYALLNHSGGIDHDLLVKRVSRDALNKKKLYSDGLKYMYKVELKLKMDHEHFDHYHRLGQKQETKSRKHSVRHVGLSFNDHRVLTEDLCLINESVV